ncbi:MAG: tyrosine--tRNA ligase [Gemmatimonadota bacterium]
MTGREKTSDVFAPITQQMDEIRRDAAEIIPEDDLVRKLERSLARNEPLRVKQGFDPTRPDLHIGHAVSMRKLRTFQQLGHEVIFVVGDYTARVGDPSGRSEARPKLSPAEIDANARTYADQVSSILDVSKVRVEFNSKWLAPLDLAGILELTATYTVARMLERDDFAKRYQENRPISIMEFMYPLMQAYDSVALNADVELGGTDQKFNLLVGRTVQERYGQEPQVCLIMPLLRGTDGDAKMSKSYGNYIGLTEPPEEQYGKTMSIPDALLEEWYELASLLPPAELAVARELVRSNPYQAKRELAAAIARTYHGDDGARRAAEHFDRVFKQKAAPDDLPVVAVSLSDPALRGNENGVSLVGLLVVTGLAGSNTEAVRLIQDGSVAVDGEKHRDRHTYVSTDRDHVLRKGSRHYVKVTFIP